MANDMSTKKLGPLPPWVASIGVPLMVLLGIAGQVGVMSAYRRGDMQLAEAMLMFAFALALTLVGLWAGYERYVLSPKSEARLARIAALHPREPWMLNDAWRARQVIDRSSTTAAIFLWIWVAGWWAGCALIWGINGETILASVSSSWGSAALAMVLVSCGLVGIWSAVALTIKWWRYGTSALRLDTLPGYLGDRFRGTVEARIPAGMPLEGEIACEHVTVVWARTPKGGRRKELVVEPIWSFVWPIEGHRMTRTKDGGVLIPVDVGLPEGLPPFDTDAEGGGIRWRLQVRTDYGKDGKSSAADATMGLDRIAMEYLIPVYARA